MKQGVLLTLLLITVMSINAQKCTTMERWECIKTKHPNAEHRMQQLELKTQKWIEKYKGKKKRSSIITIPVVVHVLYHTSTENITDAQIFSQIEALNWDFRLQNEDSLMPTHPFWIYSADCGIEFCLAQQDPEGNPTTGITRTYTDSSYFSGYDYEKFDATGGKDNWDPTKYLNFWVCNLDGSDGTLGYASFPSELSTDPELDGIVIDFRAFGYTGTAGTDGFEANDYGRTAVHEVGHWLNLFHIWGDDVCGDDLVADTPPQEEDNSGCPTFPAFPFNGCGSDANGEMYMNYMDYVDDTCMVMFTFGQADRMDAALLNARSAILSSQGCSTPVGIATNNKDEFEIELFPNPSNGIFYLNVLNKMATDVHIVVFNIHGALVHEFYKPELSAIENLRIDLSNKLQGVYLVSIKIGNNTVNKKGIIKN
ncbi:MAG: M43 family zinc metalloprotease [Chitinophagales bacterium]